MLIKPLMNKEESVSYNMLVLIKKDYPIIDIGDKVGSTDYIDFIKYSDITSSVSKGCDRYGRPFLVIRALITKSDGSTNTTLETFFQRYDDTSYLWHGCGHADHFFLNTVGGLKMSQVKFIINLIENKYVYLTDELMNEVQFNYRNADPIKIELI